MCAESSVQLGAMDENEEEEDEEDDEDGVNGAG